ncbi:MAG: branched-chain amino acid transport system II carrier protein [Pusillimonas sp.]
MQKLKLSDLIALGFMTFALFLGAGNIIFPPLVGLLAGDDMGMAAAGFLLTGVGLPLVTIIALARVGGGLDALTAPVGRVAGVVFAVLVYLAIGPLFAAPRTAVVSFEIGLAPFVGEGPIPLLLYSLVYFALVLWITLNPTRLIDNVGKVITPVLIIALLILGGAAVFAPAGDVGGGSPVYDDTPLIQGFLQGYQTMDALAALVFGIVVVNAIRGRGIQDQALQARYAIWAAAIAAVGLALVYVSLIYLGASSGEALHPGAETGVPLLSGFTRYAFGTAGTWVLTVVIVLACLTTAVGVLTACGQYFSVLLNVSYAKVVVVFCLFSAVVANLGLAQLINVSVPVLVAMYPVAIVLVLLSLLSGCFKNPSRVFVPAMTMAAIFGAIESLKMVGLAGWLPGWLQTLPGASLGLGWLVPVVLGAGVGLLADRLLPVCIKS